MNFFRSEEHLRNWEGFQEKRKGGIISLSSLMETFSGPYFKNRRDADFFSRIPEYSTEMIASLDKIENAGSYWRLGFLEKFGLSIGQKLGLM
jgi:hypothetical protein